VIHESNSDTAPLVKWFLTGAIIWSSLIAASLYWNYTQGQQQNVNLARNEALANFNKDKAFRFWGASHGGVYVPITERTQPNPRLAHIPERDITTPSGKKLTLMNPAYMLRTMMNEYEELYGVKGKITTFPDRLFYQGNMPDAWELAALKRFEHGDEEALEISDIDGVPHMRLMRPLFMQENCMKCHGYQGYAVGDLRGAVGVSVSMKPYQDSQQKEFNAQWVSYFLLWLIGLGVLGYFYTRATRSVRELQAMQQQFIQSQKMEVVRTMVNGLGSDFNDILASMTSNLYQLKKSVKGSPDAEQQIGSIEMLTYRAGGMINKLQGFASQEGGSMEPLLFTPFMNDTVQGLRPSLPENITIGLELCSDNLPIRGNAIQLQQIVQNLINNACDAVEDATEQQITIRLESFFADDAFVRRHAVNKAGSYAHLVVQDSGRGIPEHQVAHLFEPFFTTKNHGMGAGLGLAMVYGILNTHQGFIEVESVEGEGSSFHIYLPLLAGK